ncbi:transglutaminase N-terminal domain-containing protein [Phycisphaerales bacterium AB-hyl4]|uniref:Transglutaminase N-terminal domain-containing protein n=1 Tax=Natronomicrosphaera hydrolytica TaxID=3242702 RepID=A0ABV4U1X1_9BACT
MRYLITHQLCYRYDRPVFFEPTVVRVCPRHDHIQELLSFDVEVKPTPAGMTSILDAHDNRASVIWFNDMHEQLWLQSKACVKIRPYNPFAFLLTHPEADRLPVAYSPDSAPVLAVYRQRSDTAEAIDALARELQQKAGGQTLEYLRQLVTHIPDHCQQVHRDVGAPWPASETLVRGEGSCRDLTLLFMELCRAMGMAARFVSGYCTIESLGQTHELHAWAEVYLPGAGWRGYDPTAGVATAEQHIALAVAADAVNAAPSDGRYRGTDATSEFEYEVQIEVEKD